MTCPFDPMRHSCFEKIAECNWAVLYRKFAADFMLPGYQHNDFTEAWHAPCSRDRLRTTWPVQDDQVLQARPARVTSIPMLRNSLYTALLAAVACCTVTNTITSCIPG